jgi:cyclophilin family peptidyl-prolyl cis-trans isomerase
MTGSIAGGAILSGTMRGGGSTEPAISPTPTATQQAEEISPTAEPSQVKTYPNPPDMTIDTSKQYFAVIETEKGDISLELFDDEAPQTVNNFVFLARDGFYDDLIFYRVIEDFVAQAGDPTCTDNPEITCTGTGGPGYYLPKEESGLSHDAGVVAMAAPQAGEELSGSQFYITYAPQPSLDGRDTVFGRVEKGMNVAQSLTLRNPSDPNAPPGDKILSVTIEEREETPTPTE